MATEAEIAMVLSAEFIFFHNVVLGPELTKAWTLHFRNVSAPEFAAAMHLCVNQSGRVWPPTPGEVWDMIRKLRADTLALETADEAWHAVYKNKNPSKRAQEAARLMADWHRRDEWLSEHVVFKKKEFERIYNDLKQRDEILETQGVARTELGYSRDALSLAQSALMERLGWK